MGYQLHCPDIYEGTNFFVLDLIQKILPTRQVKISITPRTSILNYQYSGESPKKLIATNYELIQTAKNNKITKKYYFIACQGYVIGRHPKTTTVPAQLNDGQLITAISSTSYPGDLTNINLNGSGSSWQLSVLTKIMPVPTNCPPQLDYGSLTWTSPTGAKKGLITTISNDANPGFRDPFNIYLIEQPNNTITCTQSQNNCFFSISKCGEIILQENRIDCPTVTPPACVSDIENQKEISITLNPFDILIVAKQNFQFGGSFLESILSSVVLGLFNLPLALFLANTLTELFASNPSECLLIVVIRNFSYVEIIDQTCSICDCPAPDYYIVECLESGCPSNSCLIDCGDYYCCYDANGIAINSFLK